jgi:hypothetical protein
MKPKSPLDRAKREKNCGEYKTKSGAPDQSADGAILQRHVPTAENKPDHAISRLLLFPTLPD